MFCPSCGAEVEADTRFAHLVVCDYCESAIVVDEKAARISGKMAALAQTPSPFFVGGTGRVLDRDFRILGRVRYGYEMGYWDEWYLAFEDGSTVWISEDGDDYMLESMDEDADVPVEYASVAPGDHVQLGETDFHVDEKNVAECEGGEGQLPFAILSGEKVPFIDLSAGEQFATVEFDLDEGTSRLYRGRRLDLEEVEMDMTAEEAGVAGAAGMAAETEGGEGKRERVVRSEDRKMEIKCYYCGAPLETPEAGAASMECNYCGADLDLSLRKIACDSCGSPVALHGGDDARSVVCAACGSQLDMTSGEPSVLGSITDEDRPVLPFKLGQNFNFRDTTYKLIGHLRYKEDWYIWDEFLLHNKETGYRWLTRENGHYSFGAEIEETPDDFNLNSWSFPAGFRFRDRNWRFYESGTAHVTFVDGELPWVAKIGDEVNYADSICPPYQLSAEWTETEAEWFEMEYVDQAEVADAFGIDQGEMREPSGVAANQPYPAGPLRRQHVAVVLPFALLFVAMSIWALWFSGEKVDTLTIAPSEYASEYVTEAFEITESGTVCRADFHSTVDNSWVYLGLAVLNEEDKALMDFSTEISYYHGYSGGESLTEGSRKDSVTFKLKEPGKYRFLVKGEAGGGRSGRGVERYGKRVKVTIYQGVVLARYYILGAVGCLVVAGVELFRRIRFEAQRQGEATGEYLQSFTE
jgi:hypothetical protein